MSSPLVFDQKFLRPSGVPPYPAPAGLLPTRQPCFRRQRASPLRRRDAPQRPCGPLCVTQEASRVSCLPPQTASAEEHAFGTSWLSCKLLHSLPWASITTVWHGTTTHRSVPRLQTSLPLLKLMGLLHLTPAATCPTCQECRLFLLLWLFCLS